MSVTATIPNSEKTQTPAASRFLSPAMSDKEFKELRSLIFDSIGIEIREHKKHLLVNRLAKRLRQLGLPRFSDYLGYLETSQNRHKEMVELVDAVTTNKTDFFREPKHFQVMDEVSLPALLADPARNNRNVKVWCSASSSGEEPYTLAICLAEYFQKKPGWTFEILASDVSETMLRTAASGIYPEERIQPVQFELLRKYFLKGEKRYKVKPELTKHVTYKKINLKHDFHNSLSGYDIIFCRNVLIYFNQDSQDQIIEKHWRVLKPGGYLFLGHSETLHKTSGLFEYIAPSVYRKPMKSA
ncbi:MAG: protein-glutamate O-methyltransferase [Candidatus Hinthialibacter antarcticus]|nr:protein-glutamate O-methyltransferase [Candidatus Hinthialibacter antarcticus]